MPLSSIEKVNQLFLTLKANPGVDTSCLCEQIIESFPFLIKDDQKIFADNFYKWAVNYKSKHPLIFCFARHLKLADQFFCEQHEAVLSEGSLLQKEFLVNNEPAAAAAVETFLGSTYRTLGNIDLALKSL